MVLCNEPLELLFTRRSSELRNYSGQISFPGGKQDIGESIMDTALRETREEIGLTCLEILGPFYTVPSKNSETLVTAFIGYTPNLKLTDLRLNPQEVSEAFLVPISELQKQDFLKLRTFYFNSHIIWGLTGYLTSKFINDVYFYTIDCFLFMFLSSVVLARLPFSLVSSE
eukprot:NODE_892_length_3380_cov_0.173728.p1 type:complete len:170 gc:universal NODE_892_length_3380_cov_0.173728:1501-992(-)